MNGAFGKVIKALNSNRYKLKMKLKELTQQLKLSPTAVSHALNNYPEVNPTTRERIKVAAQNMYTAPITAQKALLRAIL